MNHYEIFVELLFVKLLKPYLVARHHQLCGSRPPKIRRSVTEFVVSNVSNQHSAFIFKDQPLKTKTLCFFKWWGAACQQHVAVIHKTWIPRYSAAAASKVTSSYRIELPFTHWSYATNALRLWVVYTLITNLMHWLLFIHKILFSSTCFEHQVLIFRRT